MLILLTVMAIFSTMLCGFLSLAGLLYYFIEKIFIKNCKMDKHIIVFIIITTISFVLIFAFYGSYSLVDKNIERETSTMDISTQNCYIVTSNSENSQYLFIFEDKDGKLFSINAVLKETSSTPYIEKTTFCASKMESFLTLSLDEKYVVYSSPEFFNYIPEISDIKFE